MKKLQFGILIFLSSLLISCTDKKDENTWVVGTSLDNPPYEYMKNGKPEGFDIDLMIAIGKYLGKKIEFKNMEFQGLLAALATNNIDMVIAGISVTPERQAKVDFSIPYTEAKIAFLHRGEDKFNSPEDLKEVIAGAQLGTIWALIAHNMAQDHDFKVNLLGNNLMLVEELKTKRIDVVIVEELQGRKFTEQHPELSSFGVKDCDSSFAIALSKNFPYKNNIDDAIKALKNDGTLDTIARKWGIIGGN